jgi:hypothetical protein
MDSQWRVVFRPLTAESETVLLTGDSALPEIEDIADNTDESPWSSRVAPDWDTAATNTNDAVEWLTRVLRCAVHGQGAHDAESDKTRPDVNRPSCEGS